MNQDLNNSFFEQLLYEYIFRVMHKDNSIEEKMTEIKNFGQRFGRSTLISMSKSQNYEIFQDIESFLNFIANDFWNQIFRVKTSSISKSNQKTITFNILNYSFLNRVDC